MTGFPLAVKPPQAAVMTGTSAWRIREACRCDELRHRMAGRTYLIAVDDLLAWVKGLDVDDDQAARPAARLERGVAS